MSILCTDCNRPVKPVVAWDIDGTMADYHGHLIEFVCRYYDLDYGYELARSYNGSLGLAEHIGITKEQYRQAKLAYRQGGMKRTQPMFEDAATVVRLLRALGCETWVTTTRPYNRFDSTDPDTRHWLERHRIPYDHLLYDDDKYGVLADTVGAERVIGVVDDLADNYDRAEELGLNPILRKTMYNRAIQRPVEATTLRLAAHMLVTRTEQWRTEHGM